MTAVTAVATGAASAPSIENLHRKGEEKEPLFFYE